MAAVFLERGLSPIPIANGEHLSHREPRPRVCQFAHCRTQRPANPKRNSLLNLDFLGSRDAVQLKDNPKQLSKTNNGSCQKLTMNPLPLKATRVDRGNSVRRRPEATSGGGVGLVENGDRIAIDVRIAGTSLHMEDAHTPTRTLWNLEETASITGHQ